MYQKCAACINFLMFCFLTLSLPSPLLKLPMKKPFQLIREKVNIFARANSDRACSDCQKTATAHALRVKWIGPARRAKVYMGAGGGGEGGVTLWSEKKASGSPTVYSTLLMWTVLRVLHGNVRKMTDPFSRDLLSPYKRGLNDTDTP